MSGLKKDGDSYRLDYSLGLANGEKIWVRETGTRLTGDGNDPDFIGSVFQDVSGFYSRFAVLEKSANLDDITGLASERYFNDVTRFLSGSASQIPIIRIIIKNLLDIASVYGPAATEYLISAIAQRIRGEISPDDLACFNGEAEFRICVPGLNTHALLNRSKKIRFILDAMPFESAFGPLSPECAISIENAHPAALDAEIETDWEDETPADITSSIRTAPITESDILDALEEHRFELVLQPICAVSSRTPEYYEALLRFRHLDGRLQSAFPYIKAAEEFGLIAAMDLRTIRLAKNILRFRKNLKLSVNISAGTLKDEKAFGAYLAEVESLGEHATRMMVELTETMALNNLGLANLFSTKLQSYGVKLAIDDFGAGHTSFKNLLGLEAQVLKIDGHYIQDIAVDSQKQNFVRLLTEMADVFGLKTVAEKIDNEGDARMVERLGVDYMQGFYLGLPTAVQNVRI